jgi:peptidoglycan/xylan/chitin deacetylase (PgdA/CDA1 family)
MLKRKIFIIAVVILLFIFAILWQLLYSFLPPKYPSLNQQIYTGQPIKYGEKVFVPILAFHHISNPPKFLDRFAKGFFIDTEKLESIIQNLLRAGYKPVFVSEIVEDLQKGIAPPDKIIALTFDDGDEDFYTNAWPILAKYNVKSSIYVITGAHSKGFLTTNQILELDKSGLVEIGSHTVSHPFLTRISAKEQYRQLKESKDYLEKLLNKKVDILCYPFGLYNKEVEEIAKEVGYRAGLRYNYSVWQDPTNLFEMSRLGVLPYVDILKLLEKMKKE